jgi:hypothetical protein
VRCASLANLLADVAVYTLAIEFPRDERIRFTLLFIEEDTIMARLPTRGASIATPCRPLSDFVGCLADLGVRDTFDEGALKEAHLRLGQIVGRWMAEKGRLDSRQVAKSLISMSKQLNEIGTMLKGHETGIRDAGHTEIVSQLAEYMALEPTVGSIPAAQELIASFVRQGERIAHSSLVAGVALKSQAGSPGRSLMEWHDDFTALLLDLAQKAGVRPTSSKDRITGKRSGWLFDAATVLETFLDAEMRSPNDEARGQRVDRSRSRLPARQKPVKSQ